MKLNARTDSRTIAPGASSHGADDTARMFCASNSSTPQLITGCRKPKPRKLSEVSAIIIVGTASVVVAIMWLMKLGTMCLKIVRKALDP